MLHSFKFKTLLEERKPLIGLIQTLDSLSVTEILSAVGFDWLFLDLEHSAMDVLDAQRLVQAAGSACPYVIRIPCHEETWIKKSLDTGAAGIIVPRVNTAEEAAAIIRFSKYPPEGCRSVGYSRAHGFGASFGEYVKNANRDIAVILQIEDIKAVRNIESIVKVPGIDALFIGPYDLSGSMGKIGQVKDPDVQREIETVRRVCQNAGMPTGIFTSDPTDVKALIDNGFTLIAAGIDTAYFNQSLNQALSIMK
ncbi:MAG: HpcH/HpaI aldolase family protein [Candidatus Omnitrophota bacterium]